jgi:thiol-disulfide isomerase/thioredoxin
MAVVAIKSASDLVALPAYSNGLVVLSFWAAWSEPSKQMNTVVAQLSKQYQAPSVQFATVSIGFFIPPSIILFFFFFFLGPLLCFSFGAANPVLAPTLHVSRLNLQAFAHTKNPSFSMIYMFPPSTT